MNERIRRLRRRARRWLGRCVEIENFSDREFKGVITRAGTNSLTVRTRRGRFRIFYRNIAEMKRDDDC